jgi:hypothetical protein
LASAAAVVALPNPAILMLQELELVETTMEHHHQRRLEAVAE